MSSDNSKIVYIVYIDGYLDNQLGAQTLKKSTFEIVEKLLLKLTTLRN